jgi:mRNA interferase MazF
MKRGDLVTVALAGDYGKPRPALVVQSDFLAEADSVLVCLLTSTQRDAPFYRFNLPATAETGLREPSQVMLDKIMAVRRARCGPPIGSIGQAAMAEIGKLLTLMLGVVD